MHSGVKIQLHSEVKTKVHSGVKTMVHSSVKAWIKHGSILCVWGGGMGTFCGENTATF